MYTLSQISLGNADGETEAESEKFLDMFYTENNKYNELLERNKYIVSGRKGTGKTILAKYLEKTLHNHNGKRFVKYKKLQDIDLHRYIELNRKELSEGELDLFQEFYIYRELSSIIIENSLSRSAFVRGIREGNFIQSYFAYRKYKTALDKLETFVNERYGDGNYTVKELSETLTQQSVAEIGSSMSKVSARVNENNAKTNESRFRIKEYYEIIEEYKRKVQECLRFITTVFIVDDLEDMINKFKPLEKFYSFITRFIKVVRKINIEIQKINPECKCIILIRNDILSNINIYDGNINKQVVDAEVELNWMDRLQNKTLQKMIFNKIIKSNDIFKNVESSSIEKILMPPSRSGNESFMNSLLQYTFGRPRDVVMFLNIIIKNYPDEPAFLHRMLRASEAQYSQKFLGELMNEMSTQVNPNYAKEVEKLLRSWGRPEFEYEEMRKHLIDNLTLFPSISKRTFEIFMEELYKLGAVGNVCAQGRNKNKKKYTWSYRPDGAINLDATKRFTVHFGLRKALNLL